MSEYKGHCWPLAEVCTLRSAILVRCGVICEQILPRVSFRTLLLLVLHLTPSHHVTSLLLAAVRRDCPADRRPGGHGGALHPAPGRGAEGGATSRPHRGRLRPGEQDGEGLPGHPQGHRLHRLPLHPLRDGGMPAAKCCFVCKV